GNRNNHIGVPLSLLEVRDATEVAVLEIGANHIGETAFLSELIAPQYGLITNNGKDHLEGYGSVEGVKRGNAELYEYLHAHDGLAFVHADDAELMQMSTGLRQFTYGSQSGADVRGELITAYPLVTVCVEQVVIRTRLTGAYNFSNIMAAVAMGIYFNVPLAAIREALAAYEPRLNRSQVVEKDGNIFLMDAYNANPSSMEAALRSFFDDPRGPKWVMLGDMAELGHATAVEHRAIVELLRSAPLAGGCLVGPAFGQADAEGHFLHFADVQQLRQWYRQSGLRGYLVLVKGSRNQRLEGLFEETAS
ncbi:MAG: Mur ligase family protein, partial [Chitinophagales bacterium]|nr:Mur ligase family protein [Chitinophagales bacterium]